MVKTSVYCLEVHWHAGHVHFGRDVTSCIPSNHVELKISAIFAVEWFSNELVL